MRGKRKRKSREIQTFAQMAEIILSAHSAFSESLNSQRPNNDGKKKEKKKRKKKKTTTTINWNGSDKTDQKNKNK
jgi:hypothetical protein